MDQYQQPQPMTPGLAPQAQAPAAQALSSEVTFINGITVFSGQKGILTLSGGYLTFQNKLGQLVLSIPVNTIVEVTDVSMMLQIIVNTGQRYQFSFKGKGIFYTGIIAGGILGLLLANEASKGMGTTNWVNEIVGLNPAVRIKDRTLKKGVSWGVKISLGFVIILVVFILISVIVNGV